MRIVAFANQKGGVGKTTTAVNSAVVLAERGYRALLVDTDPQGNATSSLGLDKEELDLTTYDALVDGAVLSDVVIPDVRPNLALLPATSSLASAEVDLVEMPDRERQLARTLSDAQEAYDVVLIDCPPSLGLLTLNALTAADGVVVPIQCEYLALEGMSQLVTTIDLIKRHLNPPLDLLGVLMTMYDGRTRLSGHVVDEVKRFFPEHIFEVIVPRSVRLAEAPSYGQAITEYDPNSRGGEAYADFAEELLTRLNLAEPASAI